MKNNKYLSGENFVDFLVGDAREKLLSLKDNSIDLILTDPPYFIDGLNSDWKKGSSETIKATGSVGGLPVGMKFDPKQGRELQKFISQISIEWSRILKPGGFALVFSQPRLAHRIAIALEDEGFEIRDQIIWHFTQRSQAKAFSMNHFVNKMNIEEVEKQDLIKNMRGRKTPQLRPQYESIILAQKPKQGTFIENWSKFEVGLIDTDVKINGKTPSNVMNFEKPSGAERAATNGHLTPKPIELLEHLIKIFTIENQIILDCFLGSGSTAIAAINTNRNCVGIDINPEYIKMAIQRLQDN